MSGSPSAPPSYRRTLADRHGADASMRPRAMASGLPAAAGDVDGALAGHERHLAAAPELYATSRLVDLLIGPLDDRGRAVAELRRLADRHPGTPEGAHAVTAIARHKAELFAGAR